ncbi:hypothetical protein M422DRAFT_781165 [Sphaerobolus stellatus SS14]|uniref:Unplaced genomic scaffold SPHSTscaffold_80, whole genome shotgun sequence n=1 Tax=Sphaerobolus stellatus (strain SS14) TaxID=990650 RepID=A0A0C9UVX9_SPHS4|nr:hypothetical protein M422DRAFT_781165 [Sphaerobolus stellatus SS14]
MTSASQPLGTIAIQYSDTSKIAKSTPLKLSYQVRKDLQAISTGWDCDYLKVPIIPTPGENVVFVKGLVASSEIRQRLASFPALETPDKSKLSHISKIVIGVENLEEYRNAVSVTQTEDLDNRPAKRTKYSYKRQSISPLPDFDTNHLKRFGEVDKKAATKDLGDPFVITKDITMDPPALDLLQDVDFDSFINLNGLLHTPVQSRQPSMDTEAIVERTGTEQGSSPVYYLIKDVQTKLEKADEERRRFEDMIRERIFLLEDELKKERLARQATENELKKEKLARQATDNELKKRNELWDQAKLFFNS